VNEGRAKEETMARISRAYAVIAVAGIAVVVAGASLHATGETKPEVTIRLFAFRPSPLAVTPGTPVTWENQDAIRHTITSGTPEKRDGRFSVELNGKGTSGTVQFTQAGVYPYFCERHQSMRGEIRVN
jgi:plastocyanin